MHSAPIRHAAFALLATLALLLGGCATDQRQDTLTSTLNAYANAVRWNGVEDARQFLSPAYRATHPLTPLDLDRYRQLRVSEYDDSAGPQPDGADQVMQVVKIGLINVNTQTERSVVDHQVWRYDPASKHWWLVSGLYRLDPSP